MQEPVSVVDTLDALYSINKVAKNYSNQSQEAYRRGYKQEAKVLSIKKSSLYEYKSYILQQLYDSGDVERVKRHEIDESDFYCFYFDTHSFHSPVDDFDEPLDTGDMESTDITNDFSSGAVSEDELPMSEKTALKHLQERFVPANRFVQPKILSASISSRSLCWEYLDEYVEEGERVSEEEFKRQQEQSRTNQAYQFAVGDVFETVEKGEIQILDRGGLWTDAVLYSDYDTILCRPVYDILGQLPHPTSLTACAVRSSRVGLVSGLSLYPNPTFRVERCESVSLSSVSSTLTSERID